MFNQFFAVASILLTLTAATGQSAAQTSEHPTTGSATLSYASFGSVEISVDAPTIKPKAVDLFYRTGREQAAYSICSQDEYAACPPEVRSWRASIGRLNGLSGVELLTAVNSMVNQLITYRDDLTAYGKDDHWATPTESLTGYGDCEDYAFLKYLSLVELGIPHEQMRIVILKDKARNIGHAVLAVSLNDGTYVLDNVIVEPMLDSTLPHYQPIFSFNMGHQWLNVAVRSRSEQVAANDAKRAPVTVIPPAARSLTSTAKSQTGPSVE